MSDVSFRLSNMPIKYTNKPNRNSYVSLTLYINIFVSQQHIFLDLYSTVNYLFKLPDVNFEDLIFPVLK